MVKIISCSNRIRIWFPVNKMRRAKKTLKEITLCSPEPQIGKVNPDPSQPVGRKSRGWEVGNRKGGQSGAGLCSGDGSGSGRVKNIPKIAEPEPKAAG